LSKDISKLPLALVVGHESYGVSASALNACDEHVRIRTVGIKTLGRLDFQQKRGETAGVRVLQK
jgi:hypothetical protein